MPCRTSFYDKNSLLWLTLSFEDFEENVCVSESSRALFELSMRASTAKKVLTSLIKVVMIR